AGESGAAGASGGPGQQGTDQQGTGQQGAGQQGSGQQGTGQQGGGVAGSPGASGQAGTAGGGASGPLTPAEQVAILDARLEKGTGEFDSMILAEQTTQRSTARQRPQTTYSEAGAGAGGSAGGGDGTEDGSGTGEEYGGGGYSTGSGIGGGAGGGGGDIPQNAAKSPPPKDIPSGNDDDVVARQLREAAMREPDPAVREKLWDEYRKYKGISK
ncbi:MAG: hypothetical protein ACRCVD_08885, partial [Halioglobus sp.]